MEEEVRKQILSDLSVTELNLSGYLKSESEKLRTLPSEIGQLTNLQTLYLSGNKLTELPSSIAQLTNLQILYLFSNRLTELPSSIGQLTNLQTLNLSINQLTELPASIGQLTNLQTLDLYNNQLTELPSSIAQLTNLQTLNLSINQLTELPSYIIQLTNLQTLNLSYNQLTELPSSIAQLINLQTLNLHYNQLTELPPSIAQLTNLQTLDLSNNKLTELPSYIIQLTNLRTLYLSDNQLTGITSYIVQLTNLQTLHLSNNKLTELPSSIAQLTNLQALYLSNNQLKTIPVSFQNLKSLQELYLTDNNLEFPFSTYQQDYKETPTLLFQFLRDISMPSEKWTQVKLVTIGHGGVGKTTLIKAIKQKTEKSLFSRNKVIEPTNTTIGIDIHDVEHLNVMNYNNLFNWMRKTEFESEIKMSVWDFAGQLEYSVNHQYFLSSWNVIYLLVIDVSKSLEIQKEHVEYWIRYLKSHLDSDDLSIIVVGNRLDEIKDKKEATAHLNETANYLEDLKNKLIYGYALLSAKNVAHIDDLISVLQQKCNSMDKTKFMIPKLYKMTAESLQNTDVPFLMDAKEYLQACYIFLHNIGVIVYNSRKKKVCTKPGILSQLMACFAFNSEHDKILLKDEEKLMKLPAILSEEFIKKRIKQVLKDKISTDEAIRCLEEFDYFFKLLSEEETIYNEKGYILPSLRPEGDFALEKELEKDTSNMKTIGLHISNKHPIGSFFFFRFQVASRNLHERENVIFLNTFRLQKLSNIATIWMDEKKDSIQVVIQGEEPASLWKEIEIILRETAQDFPGYHLTYFYLCPRCISEQCGSRQLKSLPEEILIDKFSARDQREEREVYVCKKGHRSAAQLIRGYREPRKKGTGLEETFQENVSHKATHSHKEEYSKEEVTSFSSDLKMRIHDALLLLAQYSTVAEIPTGKLLNLCPLLGSCWVALLAYFDEELIHVKNEIEHTVISAPQKAVKILNGLRTSNDPVPVAKLKTFIEKELGRL